jgi:peptidoglycan-associated lipoprotein
VGRPTNEGHYGLNSKQKLPKTVAGLLLYILRSSQALPGKEAGMRRLVMAVVLALVATGCATTEPRQQAPAGVDVSGHWTGRWSGYGILDIAREQEVKADLMQDGDRGRGVLVFEGVNASESAPLSLRDSGAMGIRVLLHVSGSNLIIEHELGGHHFSARMRVDGDRMSGRVRDSNPDLRLVLLRGKPGAPPAPSGTSGTPGPAAPLAPPGAMTPAPPPPLPEAPEAPKAPEVAVAPPPPKAPESTPEATTRPAPKDFQAVPELKPIYFDFDKADIRSDDAQALDASAQWLKDHPDAQLLIEGHADERGTNEYNLALGERRARAARDYLVGRGVPDDRISTVSYGEERPACTEKNDACWTLNRRAEFLVKTQ